MLVSACMIAKDEEVYIERAIRSLAPVADEVILVDTGSTDRTVELAANSGARVYREAWRDDFSLARNASLRRARGEWIIILDADEFFEPDQARSLRNLLEAAELDVVGYHVFLANLRRDEEPYDIRDMFTSTRVFRNRAHHRYEYPIHEQIVNSLTDGRIERAEIRLLHSGYIGEVAERKAKGDRNRWLLEKMVPTIAEENVHRYYVQMQLGQEYNRLLDHQTACVHYAEAFSGLDRVLKAAANRGYATVMVTGYCFALIQCGRSTEAYQVAEEAIEHGLAAHSVWFYRGWAQLESGHISEGVRDLLWSVALSQVAGVDEFLSDQDFCNAWFLSIQALIRTGAVAAAAALTIRALSSRPTEERFIALATALAEAAEGGLRSFVVERCPDAALPALAAKAVVEGRLATAFDAKRRLESLRAASTGRTPLDECREPARAVAIAP